eukprot:5101992-Amphidinium_carterae.1
MSQQSQHECRIPVICTMMSQDPGSLEARLECALHIFSHAQTCQSQAAASESQAQLASHEREVQQLRTEIVKLKASFTWHVRNMVWSIVSQVADRRKYPQRKPTQEKQHRTMSNMQAASLCLVVSGGQFSTA